MLPASPIQTRNPRHSCCCCFFFFTSFLALAFSPPLSSNQPTNQPHTRTPHSDRSTSSSSSIRQSSSSSSTTSKEAKMTLTIPDDVRAKAEVYVGDAAGQEKTRLLLKETGLPSGLLPLKDIIECGYVEETGFVWLKQRRKVDHYFARAGRHVTYGAEVSAFADKGRLKKITGVKAKEMLIWVTLHEICVDDPPAGKLHCKAIGGLSRTFPVEAFEADDDAPAPVSAAAVAAASAREVAVAEGGAINGGHDAAAEEEVEAVKGGEAGKQDAAPEVDKKEAPDAAAAAQEGEAAAESKDVVGEVEEKLKDMTTSSGEVVHAEAVAAKN